MRAPGEDIEAEPEATLPRHRAPEVFKFLNPSRSPRGSNVLARSKRSSPVTRGEAWTAERRASFKEITVWHLPTYTFATYQAIGNREDLSRHDLSHRPDRFARS